MAFPALFLASGSEPSISSQAAPEPRSAGLEGAQSPRQRSQAPGREDREDREDEGVGRWDRGVRADQCQPCAGRALGIQAVSQSLAMGKPETPGDTQRLLAPQNP